MTVREVVAVIVVERDERGHYYASTTHEGAPLKDDSVGGWYTLLGALDSLGQTILEAQKLVFPRARFPSFKPPDSPP